MAHNQELLRLSKSKNQNHSTSLIQLAATENSVPFANGSGTFIITVANAGDIIEFTKKLNDEHALGVNITAETSAKPSAVDIEQEFDALASNDIAERRAESDNEDGFEDENDDRVEDSPPSNNVDSPHAPYTNFPTKILDGCKLLYKGHDLLNMISRFYRLECDQCE